MNFEVFEFHLSMSLTRVRVALFASSSVRDPPVRVAICCSVCCRVCYCESSHKLCSTSMRVAVCVASCQIANYIHRQTDR